MATCKACGAKIEWLMNDKGKWVPYDLTALIISILAQTQKFSVASISQMITLKIILEWESQRIRLN